MIIRPKINITQIEQQQYVRDTQKKSSIYTNEQLSWESDVLIKT